MVVDRKGRIFGKVNILDLAVVLTIIALIIALLFKDFYIKKKDVPPVLGTPCNISCTLEVKSVRNLTTKHLKNGIDLFDGRGYFIGNVSEVQTKPAMAQINKFDGTAVMAQKPDRYDVRLKVTSSGLSFDSLIMLDGIREVHKGEEIAFTSNDVASVGVIRDIIVKEK